MSTPGTDNRTSGRAIDVSVLVVSYNTCALTLECLASVYEQTERCSFEVIVVDNASDDGSGDMIERAFPEVRLVRSEANLGFAGGNNLAAGLARGRHLLLLNPDTRVLEGAIDRLVEFADADGGRRVYGGRTLFADGSLNPSSCWRRQTVWSLACRALGLCSAFRGSAWFDTEAMGGWARDSVRGVDVVSGCFLMMCRALWDRLGGFDERYFMYGEDSDLCLRARKLGAGCVVVPWATIVHHGGASERVREDKMVRLLKAKTTLIERHWGARSCRLGKALLAGWPMSRWVALWALSVFGGRFAERARTWRGVWARRREWMHGYPAVRRRPIGAGRGVRVVAGSGARSRAA